MLRWNTPEHAIPFSVAGSDCSFTEYIAPGAYANITSPGYPHGYGPNQNCSWTLQTNPGWHLGIHFHELDLEESPGCVMDKVDVYTGEAETSSIARATTLCFDSFHKPLNM